jgi:hypothetical protein
MFGDVFICVLFVAAIAPVFFVLGWGGWPDPAHPRGLQ